MSGRGSILRASSTRPRPRRLIGSAPDCEQAASGTVVRRYHDAWVCRFRVLVSRFGALDVLDSGACRTRASSLDLPLITEIDDPLAPDAYAITMLKRLGLRDGYAVAKHAFATANAFNDGRPALAPESGMMT